MKKQQKKISFVPMITVDPSMNGKYDNDPFVLAKVQRAKEFIQKAGLPDECYQKESKGKSK